MKIHFLVVKVPCLIQFNHLFPLSFHYLKKKSLTPPPHPPTKKRWKRPTIANPWKIVDEGIYAALRTSDVVFLNGTDPKQITLVKGKIDIKQASACVLVAHTVQWLMHYARMSMSENWQVELVSTIRHTAGEKWPWKYSK